MAYTVEQLYQALGRAPDPGGLEFWSSYTNPNIVEAFKAAAAGAGETFDTSRIAQPAPAPANFQVSAANVTPTAVAAAQGVPATGPTAQAALDYYRSTGDITGMYQRLAESAGMPNLTKEQAAAGVVTNIYQKNLDRDPDPSGLQNYTTQILSGVPYDTVVKEIQGSAEATAKKAAEDAAAAAAKRKGLDAPVLNRDEIAELYRSIGMNNPKAEDIGFWLEYAQYNPDVINSGDPRNQVINAFKAAAKGYGLTPTGDFGQFGVSRARPTISGPEGQVLSPLEFATPQRGVAALRGPAYMSSLLQMPAGATNVTTPFGGSGLGATGVKSAADQFLSAEMAAGRVSGPNDPRFQAKIAEFMDRSNISPAEYAAAFGSNRGGVQALYDAVRPQGIFATRQATPRPGPFALETGVSFGPLAVSPETVAREQAAAVKAATDAANAKLNPAGGTTSLLDYGSYGDSGGPSGPTGPGMSASDLGNAIALGLDALGLSALGSLGLNSPENAAPVSGPASGTGPGPGGQGGTVSVGGVSVGVGTGPGPGPGPGPGGSVGPGEGGPSPGDDGPGPGPGEAGGPGPLAKGGLITYQEGGMPKLSAREAGSQFDMSEFLDKQGRLVGGFLRPESRPDRKVPDEYGAYGRPVRDESGKITNYEFVPYESNVVFNPRLREAEARGMSPEEREAALREMLVRQGLTGISPSRGGLAGIIAREPIMRQRPQYYSYAKGGLASIAENLADKGRYGDSMLVHMSPEEVRGLRGVAMQMGGDLSINPKTGLPEANFLKKLLPILPFLPIPGIQALLPSLAAKSIAAGVIGGFTAPGKGFNFREGIKTGIKAFAGGKLMESLQAVGQMNTPTPSTGPVKPGAGGVPAGNVPITMEPSFYEMGVQTTPTVMGPAGAEIASSVPVPTQVNYPAMDISAYQSTPLSEPFPTTTVRTPSTGPDISMKGVEDAARGVKNIFTGGPEASAAFKSSAGVEPSTAFTLGTLGYGLMEGDTERQAFKTQQAALARADEDERERYREIFRRTLGRIPMAAGGGLVALAKGGMPTFEYGGTTAPTGEPRMVTGAGDGMSDNVPANIEGVQEARLANDEFVVPADVVADIGNGSSSAGAKKLYAMMDRIRKARHGTTEQPPEIDAERLMPA